MDKFDMDDQIDVQTSHKSLVVEFGSGKQIFGEI
jgi:hypothetical protein